MPTSRLARSASATADWTITYDEPEQPLHIATTITPESLSDAPAAPRDGHRLAT